MTKPLIEVQNLSTHFGSKIIHHQLNLNIMEGQNTVILGRSGTGKSVFLKILLRLIPIQEGQIFFEGKDLFNREEINFEDFLKQSAMVFQGSALFDSMNVYDNVGFVLKQEGQLTQEEIYEKAESYLNWVGLKNIGFQYPGELSGGMRKRVGIARAIASHPKIIFFDEPTTGLDPIMTDVISDLINRLKEEKGITSVIVTHDMKSAYKIADYIYLIEQGMILEEGDVLCFKESLNPNVIQFRDGNVKGPININH